MTRRRWLSLLPAVLLVLAAGGTPLTADTAEPAEVHALQPQPPEAAPAADLAGLLCDAKLPAVSLGPEPAGTEAGPAAANRWGGICWPECYYCQTQADCIWGGFCRHGVECP